MRVSTKWTVLVLVSWALVLNTGCEYLEHLPPIDEWHGGHGSGDADVDGDVDGDADGDGDGDKDPCEPLIDECETAFAYGENSFVDMGLTQNRWGWQIGPIAPRNVCYCDDTEPPCPTDALTDAVCPMNAKDGGEWDGCDEFVKGMAEIWAGAGRNDLSKGVHVGNLYWLHRGNLLHVDYVLWPAYELAEVHLYVDTIPIEKLAPGHFGHAAEGDELQSPTEHEFYIWDVDCEPVYIVAHAVVCPNWWEDHPDCDDRPCDQKPDECYDDSCDKPDGCYDEPCDKPDGCYDDSCEKDPDGCYDKPCDDPEWCDDDSNGPAPI